MSAAPSMRALERVIRYLRAQTSRALAGRALTGEYVSLAPLTPSYAETCAAEKNAAEKNAAENNVAEKVSCSGQLVPHAGDDARDACEAAPGFWLNRASSSGVRPVVVELHGGGFALGDARKGDGLRDWIARSFDAHVVGVEYRLAPEHPFPAQLVDALSAIALVCAGGAGVEAGPVCLMGTSAGALLAVSCALVILCRGRGSREVLGLELPASLSESLDACDPQLSGLVLHYPYLDASEATDALKERAVDVPAALTDAFARWYVGQGEKGVDDRRDSGTAACPTPGCPAGPALGTAAGPALGTASAPPPVDARDPLVSPVLAPLWALARLPRTVVMPVEGDPLASQARRFFDRVCEAGVPALWEPVCGMYHGYVEDAVDERTYLATTMPETVRARPATYHDQAELRVLQGLESVLGPRVREMPFPR